MNTFYRGVWLSMLCLAVVLLMPTAAFAAEQTVEADGYYTVGDGAEENFSVARERAKHDAMGRAAEQAAVYVEKFTSVKNHRLTQSEIKTLAAKVLKVMDAVFENTTEGNVFKIRCHVVARVEDDDALASLMSDRQKLDESLQREQEKDAKIAELNRQMEELRRQYQAAKNDGERTAIRQQVQVNDASFTAAQWVEKAIRAEDAKDYDKAIVYCQAALELDSQSYYAAIAYCLLGDTYRINGDYSKAFEFYNKSIALMPDKYPAYAGLAVIFMNVGKYEQVIENCQKTIEFGLPKSPAYATMGAAYVCLGQYEKAIEILTEAVALDPDGTYGTTAKAYTSIGAAYCFLGKYQLAIEPLNKAIALDPNFASSYNYRGGAYEKLGQRKKAKLDYAKAYELNPNSLNANNKRRSENW